MASSKRSWVLEPCPEEAPKRQKFPGHSKESIKSPKKKHCPGRRGKQNTLRQRNKSGTTDDPNQGEVQAQCTSGPGPGECSLPWEDTSLLVAEVDMAGSADADPEKADDEDAYNEFVHLVDEQYITFVQVTTFLYVVQGFDSENRSGTGSFYHLEARKNGETAVQLSCLCPDGKKGGCIHKRYYQDFRDLRFRMNEDAVKAEGAVVLFRRQMIGIDDETWINRFSVAYDNQSDAIRSRTIVTYEGRDVGGGKWISKQLLDMIVGNSDDLMDDEAGERGGLDEAAEMYMVDSANASSVDERAISYLPILPPPWASLPEDPQLYSRPSPNDSLPEVLSLESTSRSACGKQFFNPLLTTIQRECTVYALTGRRKHIICVQSCPSCPPVQKCFIGPDVRALGVFNLNNSVLFTHELLDDYTNRYTGSETPFAAFVVSMTRIYEGRGDKFVGEDLFRSAWFAFASLQYMAGDMSCPSCGEAPDTVIFDGVTTGFAKRHLRETLSPPTVIPPDPLVRYRTRHPGLQWIPGSHSKGPCTRDKFASWIKRWGDKGTVSPSEREQRSAELHSLEQELRAVGADPVAKALGAIYGSETGLQDSRVRRRYRMVFEQLSANESALQMVNVLGLESLKRFVEKPSVANASLLVDVPALMQVVEQAVRTNCHVEVVVNLCRWITQRAGEVLALLMQGDHTSLEKIRNSKACNDNWKEVCQHPICHR
ncbi:hypothetical protein VNI00_003811 [Paramarasmius palmivorus]|uniref:HMG domain-containing protein n=1 Tax=Paramarasmius palmivorus TaxID=297713 RepID=A0AAW0DKH1_9AGAR